MSVSFFHGVTSFNVTTPPPTLCCIDLLDYCLSHRPELCGLLKLLLLHCHLYGLCGIADFCQANIIQQGLQGQGFSLKTSSLMKSFAFATYCGVEVWSPCHDRVCDEA